MGQRGRVKQGQRARELQLGFTISVSLRPGLKSRVSTPIPAATAASRVPQLSATIFQAAAASWPSTASHPAKVIFPAAGAEATVPVDECSRAERCHVSSATELYVQPVADEREADIRDEIET